MTTALDTNMQHRSSASSKPAPLKNSPFLYGLGSFGLESAYKVFWGFYIFYYVDVLGLAVTLAALINVVYGIWDAVNDPLVGYLSDNTRTRWGRRRPFILVGALLAGSSLAQPDDGAQDKKPNIVIIMADDLGWGDLACYGQALIQTPQIDQLAAGGMRFTQCYSGSTVCAPSRSTLMQGLHPGHATVRETAALILRAAGH